MFWNDYYTQMPTMHQRLHPYVLIGQLPLADHVLPREESYDEVGSDGNVHDLSVDQWHWYPVVEGQRENAEPELTDFL